MEENIKEIGMMIRSVDLVFINGQISRNIKENGKMEKRMDGIFIMNYFLSN